MFTRNILLYPSSNGQRKKGVGKFPNIIKSYIKPFYNVHETTLNNDIYDDTNTMYKLCNKFNKFICIGGDHSTSIATGSSSLKKYENIKFIWIDAHPDINTYTSSITKNFHGMPLSFLTGLDKFTKPYINNELPHQNLSYIPIVDKILPFKNLCYIGIRDIDEYEQKIINNNNIYTITSTEVNNDISTVIKNLSMFIGDSPVHLSFDVDSINPDIISSTGTPVPGGLNLISCKQLLDSIYKHNIVTMDIVEMNLDINKQNYNNSLNNFKSLFPQLFT